MPWKLLASRTLIEDRWIRVSSNDYLTPDQRRIDGYYTIRRGDFVVVVAECAGELVLVREYRAGMDRQYLGFPAGYVEPGEDPVAAGMREFTEETGFPALSGRLCAELHPQAAYLESRAFIIHVEAAPRPAGAVTDGEIDEVLLLPWPAALEAARRNEIAETQAVAALYLVRDLLGRA